MKPAFREEITTMVINNNSTFTHLVSSSSTTCKEEEKIKMNTLFKAKVKKINKLKKKYYRLSIQSIKKKTPKVQLSYFFLMYTLFKNCTYSIFI